MHSLLAEETFDYIDLDPFGSPVPFLQSTVIGCRRKGILAITATDTAPLAGAHAPKCRRRYQSEPIRGFMCHEGGLRILMCTIAKELARFDRGMKPILSFYADHYFRTYVRVVEGTTAADDTLAQLGYMGYDPETLDHPISYSKDEAHPYGPFWLGDLFDKDVLERMSPLDMAEEKRCNKMLNIWKEEMEVPYLYDLSELSSLLKSSPPKLEDMLSALRECGNATRTHMCPTSFKTDLPAKDVRSIFLDVSPDRK